MDAAHQDALDLIARHRPAFRAAVSCVVASGSEPDPAGWLEIESIAAATLSGRPARVRRQLAIFLRFIEWLPVLRHRHRFHALGDEARTAFFSRLEHSRLLLVRRGFWGLRTIAFMGYYGRAEAAAEIGYAATRAGWDARRARESPEPSE